MKKLMPVLLFVIICLNGFSQSDTLFTNKQTKIPCKIQEINEFEIKYKQASNPDGPVFVIDKSTVIRYTLANGYSELLIPDELLLENEHKEILGNREVIKVHPFGLAFDHVSLAYEKVIKVGMNADIEGGYINSFINGTNNIYSFRSQQITYTGAYIKPGVKFFLGQDFSMKGLKYAHPLKGRYVRLDLAFSFLYYQGLTRVDYFSQSNQTNTVTTNLNMFAYGGFVNYGRQFILGNILTMDYYVGMGFTGQSYEYTNPAYTQSTYGNYYYNDINSYYNYHGFLRIPNFGMSFTAGFRIGYILPSKNYTPGMKGK